MAYESDECSNCISADSGFPFYWIISIMQNMVCSNWTPMYRKGWKPVKFWWQNRLGGGEENSCQSLRIKPTVLGLNSNRWATTNNPHYPLYAPQSVVVTAQQTEHWLDSILSNCWLLKPVSHSHYNIKCICVFQLRQRCNKIDHYIIRVTLESMLVSKTTAGSKEQTFTSFSKSQLASKSYESWILSINCSVHWRHVVVSWPICVRLPVRNGLVNEVEFLGLITQKR